MQQSNHPVPPAKHGTLPVVIIMGPTASGKTDLSFMLAEQLPVEIINADTGQFYKPFSVGVAKPDWQHASVPCHFFDVLDEPVDLNVIDFRKRVLALVSEIFARGNLPVIVGGSHFYLQSLFYPPREVAKNSSTIAFNEQEYASLWNALQAIDPERAAQIHPNDHYRLERALTIFKETGIKPSALLPCYDKPFNAILVAVNPDNNKLKQRINYRADLMIHQGGWIQETKQLMGTVWEAFMTSKKLIGYDHLLDYLTHKIDLQTATILIQQETWGYAKRQKKFIRRFLELIQKDITSNNIIIAEQASETLAQEIAKKIRQKV